jgi:hypothetical protein
MRLIEARQDIGRKFPADDVKTFERLIDEIERVLSDSVLGDDPAEIIDALAAAARDGASPADLGRTLAYAAALRVARFGTANEPSDWETAHHVFTYANSVHQALKRIGVGKPEPVDAVRGLLHGAMALYLARYLNVPPASLPDESGDGLDDLPVATAEIRAALLDTFDRQQQIGAAVRLVARHSHPRSPTRSADCDARARAAP